MFKKVDSKFKDDLKRSFFSASLSVVVTSLIIFFMPNSSLGIKDVVDVLLFALNVFIAIFLLQFTLCSIFAVFRTKDNSGKYRSIIASVIFLSLIAYIIFAIHDREVFARGNLALVDKDDFPQSIWKQECSDSWVEVSVQGDKTTLRCDGFFYPFYKEKVMLTKDFVKYIKN